MSSPEIADRFAESLVLARQRQSGLPVVTIDGDIAPIDWFTAWGLVDAVEDWLAVGQRESASAGR